MRSSFLAMQAAKGFAPLALETTDSSAAQTLREASDPETALEILEALTGRDWPDNVREAVGAAYRALSRTLRSADPIYTAELVAVSAARSAAVNASAWDFAIDALEGALAIGRQADPIEIELIERRAAEVLTTA